MIETFSQIEAAFRSMLVHKAEGPEHEAIAKLFGIPRPYFIAEDQWVNALHVLAYGPRGHPSAMLRFVEMALQAHEIVAEIEIKANTYLARVFDYNGAEFDDTWVDRLVRIDSVLYKVESFTGGATPWLDLVNYGSAYWAKPAFSAPKVTVARRLPFRIREATGGPVFSTAEKYEVKTAGTGVVYEVMLAPELENTPKTYLRAGTAVPRTNDPLGGHLTPDRTYKASVGGKAFPLYLDNGRRMRELEFVLDELLAAGVKAAVKMDNDLW